TYTGTSCKNALAYCQGKNSTLLHHHHDFLHYSSAQTAVLSRLDLCRSRGPGQSTILVYRRTARPTRLRPSGKPLNGHDHEGKTPRHCRKRCSLRAPCPTG